MHEFRDNCSNLISADVKLHIPYIMYLPNFTPTMTYKTAPWRRSNTLKYLAYDALLDAVLFHCSPRMHAHRPIDIRASNNKLSRSELYPKEYLLEMLCALDASESCTHLRNALYDVLRWIRHKHARVSCNEGCFI